MFVIYIAYTAHHHIRAGLSLLRVQRLQRVRLNPIVAVQVKHELPGGGVKPRPPRFNFCDLLAFAVKNSSRLIIPCLPYGSVSVPPGSVSESSGRSPRPGETPEAALCPDREMSGFTGQVQGLPRVSSFILRRVRHIKYLYPAGKRLAGFYEKRVWCGVCI